MLFDINFLLGILIQVLGIFIFLCIFFFTYASRIERDIVENQIDFILKDTLGIHTNLLPESVKVFLNNNLNQTTPIDTVNESNDAIKEKTKRILFIFTSVVAAIVGICIVLARQGKPYFKDLKLKRIIIEIIIIIIAIGLTEFGFLTFLAQDFISVDPNELKAHFFENIKNSFTPFN